MKFIHRTVGVTVASMALVLTTGCQTPGPGGSTNNTTAGIFSGATIGAIAGALIGNASNNAGAGAAIGAIAGAIAGGLIGQSMDQAQRDWLNAHSPQTLQKIDHNDAVSSQQVASAQTQPAEQSAQPQQPSPQTQEVSPLTVDDVKALAGAGVKDDVVTAEIHKSNSKFSEPEITNLQQAGVSSKVIDYIKTNAAS